MLVYLFILDFLLAAEEVYMPQGPIAGDTTAHKKFTICLQFTASLYLMCTG